MRPVTDIYQLFSLLLSVSLQMMSPSSRDLLSRVIIQSDTFLSVSYHPVTAEQAGRMAVLLQSQLGCSPDTEMLDCLKDQDTLQVMVAAIIVSVDTYTYG